MQTWRSAILLKRDSKTAFYSSEICKIFKNTFFYWTSPVSASENFHSFTKSQFYQSTKNEVFRSTFLYQMWPTLQETANWVTFTDGILNGKLYFCAVYNFSYLWKFSKMFIIVITQNNSFSFLDKRNHSWNSSNSVTNRL